MDDITSSRDRKRGHFPSQHELKTFLALVLSHYADSSSRVRGLSSDFLKLGLVIWQNNSGWMCVRTQFPSWTSSFLALYSLKGSISTRLSVLVSACRIQTYCLSMRITLMEQVVSAEGRGVGGGGRLDPWINCYQFISFTGQSKAANAGRNRILAVVKHHKSNVLSLSKKVRQLFRALLYERTSLGSVREIFTALIHK